MGFFKSKKGSIISDYFSIETDLGQFKKGNAVDVALFPDHLELQNAIGNKKTATLTYSQITDIFYGSKTQLQLPHRTRVCRRAAVWEHRRFCRRTQRSRQKGKEGSENCLHHQLRDCGRTGGIPAV